VIDAKEEGAKSRSSSKFWRAWETANVAVVVVVVVLAEQRKVRRE
jgi:anti-sigma-K factor RskA